MKILHVITSLELGGAEKLLVDLLPEQKKLGHQVDLLVLDLSGEVFLRKLKNQDIKVIGTSFSNRRSFRNIFYINRIIKNGDYDVVHAHLTHGQYWTSLSRYLDFGTSRRYVTTEHSTSNRRRGSKLLKLIDKIIYGNYDRIASISSPVELALLKWLGKQAKGRSQVIENGIDLKRYPREQRENSFKRLLMLARFHPSKDHGTLIRAMDKMRDYTLTLAGDGETMEYFKTMVKDLDLENNVTFLGFTRDVEKLLENHDIAIQSSFYEGFGLGALEAMASGLPVVGSNIPGLRDVVNEGGLLFTPESSEDLIEQIRKLENTELYREMSKRALENSERFSIENTAKKYIDFYNR